jgi:hypothetical protein
VGRLIRFRPSQIEAWLLSKERNTVNNDNALKTTGADLFTGL